MIYAMIFNDKIKQFYESENPREFTGEYTGAFSIELPQGKDPLKVIYSNGALIDKPITQEELDEIDHAQELAQLKQYMINLDIANVSNLADVKVVLAKLAKAIVRIAR